jgi:hypothetical protein
MKYLVMFLVYIQVKTLLKNSYIDITSEVLTIETFDETNTYNILLTFTPLIQDYEFICTSRESQRETESSALLEDKYIFANRTYYLYKFEELQQYIEYDYFCFDINTQAVIIDKRIKFPKNKEETRILAFGDWGISKEGNISTPVIEKFIKYNDALLFLGDLSYDLDSLGGENGNIFLKYAKEITSRIPFQVFLTDIAHPRKS